MSAVSELIVPCIFCLLGIGGVTCLFLTLKAKGINKLWTFLAAVLFSFLIFSFRSCIKEGYKNAQLHQVGLYYLTSYPGCDSCVLELKEDMTYEVRSKGNVIEKSNWHYESGGDYFITYLDNDQAQLGSGTYNYKDYQLKYPH